MRKKWIVWLAVLMAALTALMPFTVLAETALVPNASGAPFTFSTKTLDGKTIDSAERMKNYDLMMVNLWAEWCGPCMNELPDLERIHKNYKNVLLVGAYVDSNISGALSAAKRAGVTYPLIQAPDILYNYIEISAGGSFSIPQTVFFDKNGRQLGSAYVGSRDYSSWAQIVDEMLKKVPADPAPTEASKPVISVQPKSLTLSAGRKASFRVTASGEGLTYQWYYRTSSKAKWKKVSKDGTSDVYSFTVKSKQNGYQYRCLVKNSAGKVYSKTVKLKVK